MVWHRKNLYSSFEKERAITHHTTHTKSQELEPGVGIVKSIMILPEPPQCDATHSRLLL